MKLVKRIIARARGKRESPFCYFHEASTRFVEGGGPGQERTLILELKLRQMLAYGIPNVGKSILLASVSKQDLRLVTII